MSTYRPDANDPLSMEMAEVARAMLRSRVIDNDTSDELLSSVYSAGDPIDRSIRLVQAFSFLASVLTARLAIETDQTEEAVLDAVYEALGFNTF